MEAESLKVIKLLEKKRSHDDAQNYMKNIHRCVVYMERDIRETRGLQKTIFSAGHIQPQHTLELHAKRKSIIESYYKFAKRLETLSSKIKVGPSG